MNRLAPLLFAAAMLACGHGGPDPGPGGIALRLPEGVEAVSMAGDTLRPPPLAPAVREAHEARLAAAQRAVENAPDNVDSLIWLGRRLAYLGRFRDAIDVYDRAIQLHPTDPRLYRHRGHRFLTLRRADLALLDLEHAARLARDEPDEIEPDGLPNALGIPLSTLKFNIWYHLGLAHFIRADYRQAERVYREASAVARNDDTRAAAVHWWYMTLRRLGRDGEANAVIARFEPGMTIVEDSAYFRLVLMYRGLIPADSLVDAGDDAPIADAALGYGVGNWHFVNGRRAEAVRIWRRVVAGTAWPAFGHLAAEVDLHRLGENR